MEVLIYPYPEMAYFVTSFAEDDLAFGESTVVLPACQVDRELVEQLLSLYREEAQCADEDSRLIRLSQISCGFCMELLSPWLRFSQCPCAVRFSFI